MSTGLAIKCPKGTYVRISPQSGITMRQNITTLAGVIDPDYRGEIKVILHNFGSDDQLITSNQKIAQLILEQAATPDITPLDKLDTTSRGENGFGSSDTVSSPQIPIPFELDENPTSSTATAAKIQADLQIALEEPYKLHISYDPYDNHTS